MSFERKLARNILKKTRKNKDISRAWRNLRIKEVGLINYMREYNITNKRHLSRCEI